MKGHVVVNCSIYQYLLLIKKDAASSRCANFRLRSALSEAFFAPENGMVMDDLLKGVLADRRGSPGEKRGKRHATGIWYLIN